MANKGYTINKNVLRNLKSDLEKALKMELEVPITANITHENGLFVQPPVQPMNVTNHNYDNRGAVIGAIGNDNTISQAVSIGTGTQELLDLVLDMRNIIKTADVDLDDKMDLAVALNCIKEESESSDPNKTKLSEAIKSIGIKITGTALATTLKPYVEQTVNWFRNSNVFTPEQCIEILNACPK